MHNTHTPGPWSQDRWGSVIANGETLLVSGVAIPCGNHPQAEEAKANARLIAAAPELLEALEASLFLLESHGLRDFPAGGAARAAIAKATGGEP